MTRVHTRTIVCCLLVLMSQASCTTTDRSERPITSASRSAAHPQLEPPQLSDAKPREYPGLHNVVAFAAGLYSGGVPEGDAGFDSLVGLGIRTILSVDGAQPDLARAAARDLRYVHLPIGYDGMDRTRRLELARAVKELPGPIYLHCHHGKHRSAGAAGAALVTLGVLTPSQARNRMEVSGTSPSYKGLYRCVETATPADDAELQSVSNEFPSAWKTSGLVRAMVEIELAFDRLKLIEKSGWTVPNDHPDLVPAAEAGLLADLLRNLQDDERCRAKPADFMDQMMASAYEAERLEQLLVAGDTDSAAKSGLLAKIHQQCRDCHAQYRD
jgi:hypothetical protein